MGRTACVSLGTVGTVGTVGTAGTVGTVQTVGTVGTVGTVQTVGTVESGDSGDGPKNSVYQYDIISTRPADLTNGQCPGISWSYPKLCTSFH